MSPARRPREAQEAPRQSASTVGAVVNVEGATEGELLGFARGMETLAGSDAASTIVARLLRATAAGMRAMAEARARALLRWEAGHDDPARNVLMGEDGELL